MFYMNCLEKNWKFIRIHRKSPVEALYILNLIQWHMILHFDLQEKTITKYRNMLGEDTWKDLELLHKADCEAR